MTEADMRKLVKQDVRITPVSQLRFHPRNPRKGDVGAIARSIEANGFYGTIVAQESTGYVVAGNHRLAAAIEQEMQAVPVAWVDVDDETALRILTADNRTSDLGTYDEKVLAEILAELSNGSGLDGTGYVAADLDRMIADMVPPDFDEGTENDQGRLDETNPVVCPECGHSFHPPKK